MTESRAARVQNGEPKGVDVLSDRVKPAG